MAVFFFELVSASSEMDNECSFVSSSCHQHNSIRSSFKVDYLLNGSNNSFWSRSSTSTEMRKTKKGEPPQEDGPRESTLGAKVTKSFVVVISLTRTC